MVKTASKDGLTFKQRETIKAYIDPNSSSYGNAKESAKKFYKCSDNSASELGSRAIKKLNQVELPSSNTGINPNSKTIPSNIKAELTVEWVLDKLKSFSQDSKARTADKIRATELIGKYLQMFKDFSTVETKPITAKTEEDLDKEFREISGKYREKEKEEAVPLEQ